MQPITNNFDLPKPADLDTLSQDQSNTDGEAIVNLPNGLTEQAILKFCKTRNSIWDTWFTQKFKKIADQHKLWRNTIENITSRVGNSPIPLAVGYSILEAVTARMNTTLLARPKLVEAVADDIMPDNSNQENIEAFVNQKLMAETRQPEKGKFAIKGALLDGYVIARSEWHREAIEDARFNYAEDPVTREPLFMGAETEQRFKEWWTFRKCNVGNCAWDIHCETRVQDSSFFRERDFWSYNEMLQKQDAGEIQGVEALRTVTPSGLKGAAKDDWEAQLKKADGDKDWRETYSDEKLYKIDEWFAYLTYKDSDDLDEDGRAKPKSIYGHFFVAEDKVVLSFEENVLKPCRHPYISAQTVQEVDSVMGLPLLLAIKPLLDAINNYAGKQQALVEWCSNPTIFYGNKSGLAGRTTFSRPMGLQPVTDATDIKEFLANPQSVEVVQNYITFLITQAREASGANEQFQGIEQAETATQFQGLQAAAGSRFADISENLNQGLIECLAQECFYMYRQFGEDGQMVVHPQTEEAVAVALRRSDLQGNFRFIATTASNDNYRQKEISDDTQFLQMMSAMNGQGGFPTMGPMGKQVMLYNIPKHVTEISIPMRGQKSSKDMFTPAPPPPPEILTAQGKPLPVPPGGFVNLPLGDQGIPMNLRAGVTPVPGNPVSATHGPMPAPPTPVQMQQMQAQATQSQQAANWGPAGIPVNAPAGAPQ